MARNFLTSLAVAAALSAGVSQCFGAEPAKPVGGPACPVMGQGCTCGCSEGLPCSCWAPSTGACSQSVKWCRNTENGDWGVWDGDKFLGGLFVQNGCYYPYQDGKYLAACACPYQLPDALRPKIAPAPVVRQYQPAFQPFGGFFSGGGCVGGRCH